MHLANKYEFGTRAAAQAECLSFRELRPLKGLIQTDPWVPCGQAWGQILYPSVSTTQWVLDNYLLSEICNYPILKVLRRERVGKRVTCLEKVPGCSSEFAEEDGP